MSDGAGLEARAPVARGATRGSTRAGWILGFVVVAGTVACGGGATPMPVPEAPTDAPPGAAPLFVAIYPASDGGYPADQAAGFVSAIEARGGRAVTYDARRDPRLAVGLVRDAIAAGARGISITVPDGSIGPAIARLAAAAGVALVATDARIVDAAGVPVPWIGLDDGDLGTAVGDATASLLEASRWDPGEVGVLSAEVQGRSTCNDRTGRAEQALVAAGVPPANLAAFAYSGEAQSARDAAGPVIAANPQIERWVVVGCNDQGVQGALDALETARFSTTEVIGVGLGADLACRAWQRGNPTAFRASLFVYGGDVGAAAAEALWAAAMEGTLPGSSTIVHGTIVTPGTWREVVPPSFADACTG